MKDYLVKSLAYEGQLRIYAVESGQAVREAQRIHNTWSAATAALGRAIVATAMLSAASLKDSEKMTVKIMGDGPAGAIVVDGNAQGTVKGYIQNPHVHFPLNGKKKIDVRDAIGSKGFLAVTKDLGLKAPFTGQVPLVSGELGEDFTYYLAKSEQIPSAVGLAVTMDEHDILEMAGGFLVQVMPQAKEDVISKMETKLASFPSISGMMAQKRTPEEIIYELCGRDNVNILERLPISYHCDCSKKRFARSLASIAPKDLKEMIEKDHGAEATCRFCGEKYHFDENELKDLYARAIG